MNVFNRNYFPAILRAAISLLRFCNGNIEHGISFNFAG
jgi:hypothetical protein